LIRDMEHRTFNHEELTFEHDDEEFIYTFHGFPPTGIEKVKMRRLKPLPATDLYDLVYPNGKLLSAHTAVIVLYKATTQGQPMIGFLPDVLRTVLKSTGSKEAMVAGLKKAFDVFPVKNPIANVDDVMAFVEPYAPWQVYFRSTKANIVGYYLDDREK